MMKYENATHTSRFKKPRRRCVSTTILIAQITMYGKPGCILRICTQEESENRGGS